MPSRRRFRRPTQLKVIPPPRVDPLYESLGDSSFYSEGEPYAYPYWPNPEDANGLGLGFSNGYGSVWLQREGGDQPPAYQIEIQARYLLLLSRYLTSVSPHIVGAFDKLSSYCISTGFTYTVASKRKGAPEQLIEVAQHFLDDFLDTNSFSDHEQEGFLRSSSPPLLSCRV